MPTPSSDSPPYCSQPTSLVTSSGNNDVNTLRLCRDVLGADRLLFAVDYPFEENGVAIELLKKLDFSPGDTVKFFQTNAERVFRLDTPSTY